MRYSIHILMLFALTISSAWADTDRFDCGDMQVTVMPQDDTDHTYVILDKNGAISMLPTLRVNGGVVELCSFGKILLVNESATGSNQSFLMNDKGDVVERYTLPPIQHYGVSSDEKIFWFQYFSGIDREPATKVKAYSNNGAELERKKVSRSQHEDRSFIVIEFDGNEYTIEVVEPRLPG